MKEGRRGVGWEGIRRQSVLARRRTRVGSAVDEPTMEWISPAGRGATEAAMKMERGLGEDMSGIVAEVMRWKRRHSIPPGDWTTSLKVLASSSSSIRRRKKSDL